MSTVSAINVPETVWYSQMPQSPPKPEPPGLAFRIADAVSESGATIALLAAYHLGTPYLEYYGGQISRAIHVVAVNLKNGHVYHSDLNGPDHPPIMIEATDEDMASAPPGSSSESAFFNADLPVLLGLPKEAESYKVFLWLDDIISNIETIKVPENSARGKGRPVKRIAIRNMPFAADPTAPTSRPDAVTLIQTEKSGDKLLNASWFPTPVRHPEQPVLWLLATGHRDRSFGWLSVNANEIPKGLSPVTFSLKIQDLIKTTGVKQKIFAVLISAGSVSDILVLQAP